jgi:hypothetical protein
MPIYRNYELVDLNNTSDQTVKEYNAFKAETLEKFEGRMPLMFRVKYKFKRDKDGNIRPGKVTWLRWEAMRDGVMWQYSPMVVSKNEDGMLKFPDVGEIVSKSLVLDKDRMDYIFFLLKKSQAIPSGIIYLEDKVAEANTKADEKAIKAKVEYYLWVEDAINIKKLLITARAYGVQDVENLQNNEVRVELAKRLESLAKGDKGIYKKFLDDLSVNKLVKIKATLQQALDENKIFFNPQKYTLEWASVEADTNPIILQILPNQYHKKLDYATELFADEKFEIYELIKKTLDNPVETSLDINDKELMKKWAKRLGVMMGRRKDEEWKAEVLQKFENRE